VVVGELRSYCVMPYCGRRCGTSNAAWRLSRTVASPLVLQRALAWSTIIVCSRSCARSWLEVAGGASDVAGFVAKGPLHHGDTQWNWLVPCSAMVLRTYSSFPRHRSQYPQLCR